MVITTNAEEARDHLDRASNLAGHREMTAEFQRQMDLAQAYTDLVRAENIGRQAEADLRAAEARLHPLAAATAAVIARNAPPG